MGEAKRRKQAGNAALPRGRFILYGTFRKTGAVWLEAHLITPWPKQELTEPQRQARQQVLEQLLVAARAFYDEASEGDEVVRQVWLNVPRPLWDPRPTPAGVKQLLAATDRLVFKCTVEEDQAGPGP